MKLHKLPYVIGTDIVQISRFRRPDAAWLRKLSGRILTPSEFTQVSFKFTAWHHFLISNPGDAREPSNVPPPKFDLPFLTWLAGRWAAKEAARKAWGATIIGFKDVGVVYEGQKPVIRCLPLIGQTPVDDKGLIQYGCLSLSHDGDYATATVIAEPLHHDLEKVLLERANHATKFKDDTSSLFTTRPKLLYDTKGQES